MLPHWAPVAGPSHTYQARSSPPTACKAAACNQAWVSAGCCRSCAKAQRSVVSRPCASAADAPLDGSSPRPRAFTPAEPTQPAPQTAPASAGSSQEPNANAGSTSSSQQGAEAPAPVQSPPTPQHAAIAGALRESPAASLPPSLKAVRTQRMQLRLVALLFLIPLALGVLRLAIIFLDAVQSGSLFGVLAIADLLGQQGPDAGAAGASDAAGSADGLMPGGDQAGGSGEGVDGDIPATSSDLDTGADLLDELGEGEKAEVSARAARAVSVATALAQAVGGDSQHGLSLALNLLRIQSWLLDLWTAVMGVQERLGVLQAWWEESPEGLRYSTLMEAAAGIHVVFLDRRYMSFTDRTMPAIAAACRAVASQVHRLKQQLMPGKQEGQEKQAGHQLQQQQPQAPSSTHASSPSPSSSPSSSSSSAAAAAGPTEPSGPHQPQSSSKPLAAEQEPALHAGGQTQLRVLDTGPIGINSQQQQGSSWASQLQPQGSPPWFSFVSPPVSTALCAALGLIVSIGMTSSLALTGASETWLGLLSHGLMLTQTVAAGTYMAQLLSDGNLRFIESHGQALLSQVTLLLMLRGVVEAAITTKAAQAVIAPTRLGQLELAMLPLRPILVAFISAWLLKSPKKQGLWRWQLLGYGIIFFSPLVSFFGW